MVAYHPYSLPVYTYVVFGGQGLPAMMPLLLPTLVIAVACAMLSVYSRGVRDATTLARPANGDEAAFAPADAVADAAAQRPPLNLRLSLTKHLGPFSLDVHWMPTTRRLAIIGPSGSGKSLTLRLIAGLEHNEAGSVQLGERDLGALPPERRQVGYMPQDYGLFPHMTVAQQLAFPVDADAAGARYWVEHLGLAALLGRLPHQLSFGQRQRVALARALTRHSHVLLFDEPFSALDTPRRRRLQQSLRELQREISAVTVIVTHDPDEAALLADEVLVLERGRMLQAGTVEHVFSRPANMRVAELLGLRNVGSGVMRAPGLIEVNGRLVIETSDRSIAVGERVMWPPAQRCRRGEGARGPAARRLPFPSRCSPRRPAAGPRLPAPLSASRATPCCFRVGPAVAPRARAMLRRPAPALAPAVRLLLAGLLCGGGVWAARVNKHKPWLEPTYHGIVTENDNTVLLDPPLIALDKDSPLRFAGEICGFKIHGQNVPFDAVVVDKSTGEGIIRSKEKLDCELQKDYTFTIQAYDCGKGPDGTGVKKSHKATVHIQVNDVNEYAPVFKEKSYKAAVVEGKQHSSILRVEAVDADCSPQFSQICSYEILTPDVPFTVDKDGYIKNTEKLNYGKEHQYKLTVTAYDCGKKRATEDVLVKISVKPTCSPGWQGWSSRIEYEPGTGALAVFPSIHLETCDEPVASVQATVELETSHIGKGCDRDTYSEKSLHRLCGAAAGTSELLPSPSSSFNWTVGLPTDNGHDSDQVFEFNGTQAVRIPDGVVTLDPKEPFTISVWMRHGPFGRKKETILCSSDKTDMNRHHYSLYVHGCRLVFLLRQDPSEEKKYRPAEFHWKLNQVCDEDWHHFVLNVEVPSVTLYVDGIPHEPFSVTEDYPLHPTKIETQLVVGACWQGGDLHMTQFFRGNLAGLTVRSGKLADKKVIDCLYTCKEGLDLQVPEDANRGVQIQASSSQAVLTLEGDNVGELDKAMQHISYLNSRQFPTPGIRRLKITSTVKCFNEAACIEVPPVEGYVMVLQPEEPKISLSGVHHFARAASEFESAEGISLFPELRIISTITREVEPEADGSEDPTVQESLVSEEIVHDLDTCEVTVEGDELNAEQESLEVDVTRLQQKGIEASHSDLGVVFTGVETMASYEEVLHLLRYRNWHTRSLLDRKFKLICSELNGRYLSNEFKVEVNVIHTANPVEHANHMAAQPQFVHPEHRSFVDLSGHNLANPHPFAVVPSTATVVIVVCVSFLVFMIILGVFRIRAAHQRTMRDQDTGKENEMDWDDSALTITVNPMETYEDQHSSEEEEEEEEEEESEDGEEEEDITSAESESSEEEEGGPGDGQNATRQLEWDDSTLSY